MANIEQNNIKLELIDYNKKFDYVFVIMAHEEPQCLVDMICNIKTLNLEKNIGFYIHLAKNYMFKTLNDYNLYYAIKGDTVFPKNYYVHISEKSYITQWGNIGYELISTIDNACSKFINTEYFILLASNCMQIKQEVKIPWFNRSHIESKPDFGIDITFQYKMKENDSFLKNKFIKYLHNNHNAKFMYHYHEGMYMSKQIIKDFLKLWHTIYENYDDQDYINDSKMGVSEEYILGTYLLTLKDTYSTHSLCVRQPEYNDIVEKPPHEYYFIKPVSRNINNIIREKLRRKYNYNDIVHILTNNYTPYNKLDLVYKKLSENIYPNNDNNKFICEIYSSAPRIFSFDFKSTDDNICILSTGTASKNNCFNLVLNYGYVGIMCYENDIYHYSTAKINDGEWHKVIVIFKINIVYIYINELLVLKKDFYGINTIGNNCYIGQSNHKDHLRKFIGSIKNILIFSGVSDDYNLLNSNINSIISSK